MTDEEKIRAECVAEIMANPGKPYEVVTRDDAVASAVAHGIGGEWPIILVKGVSAILLRANGYYWPNHDPSHRDIMGFAPKKTREWKLKVWTCERNIDDAEEHDVPLFGSESVRLNVPITITIREGHDD